MDPNIEGDLHLDLSRAETFAVVSKTGEVPGDSMGKMDTTEFIGVKVVRKYAGLLVVHMLWDMVPWRNQGVYE